MSGQTEELSKDTFKLVGENNLRSGWSQADTYGDGMVRSYMTDRGIKTTGESYSAASNLPEAMVDMELKYTS